jgi:hypothetical protein
VKVIVVKEINNSSEKLSTAHLWFLYAPFIGNLTALILYYVLS